jgi:hypothetical protein
MSYPTYTIDPSQIEYAVQSNHINKRVYTVPGGEIYTLYRYDKDIITQDAPMCIRQCRSLVFRNGVLVSFSPPRAIPYTHFWREISNDIYVQIRETIEGMMIQLFYDAYSEKWQMATKNAVGGKYAFHRQTSNRVCDAVYGRLGNSLAKLDKAFVYTFVLRHPSNVILLPVEKVEMYLVAVYQIQLATNEGMWELHQYSVQNIPAYIYEVWPWVQTMVALGRISLPRKCDTIGFCVSNASITRGTMDATCLGWTMTDMITGERCKVMNPEYLDLKALCKIDPVKHYQYICLQRMGKTAEYREHFPKERKTADFLESVAHQFTKELHKAYVEKYVRKSSAPILGKYLRYVDRLHREIYLPSLRYKDTSGKGHIITLEVVRDFMKKQHPGAVLYAVSYDRRKLVSV